ncbi:MAG: MATE family efflux transporter [Candidatus Xenobia bacterium]
MGAQLCSLSMVFVDNLVVARLGARQLATMAMATSLYAILQVASLGLLSPISALISQAVGGGRPQMVGRTLRRGLVLALFLAFCIVAVFSVCGPVLKVLGQNPELIPEARRFLLYFSLGVPPAIAYMALRQLTEGVSDTRPSALIAAAGAIMNLVLDVGLVFGRFGLPRLGLVGSALATTFANWGMVGIMIAYIVKNPRYRRYELSGQGEDGHSLREILHLGAGISGSLLAEVGFFVAQTFLMGTIGTTALASHQLALNAASFTFMIPLGLSFAVAIRVGSAMGAHDHAGVRRAGMAALVITAVTQSITASCFLFLPQVIARGYTSDPVLVAHAVKLLRIAGLFQWFDGIQVVGMGMLRGRLDTRIPFFLTFGAYWIIGMPAAVLMGFTLHGGPSGLWYGMVVGLGAAAVLLQWRFWRYQ